MLLSEIFEFLRAKLDEILGYFMLKSFKKLNFRAKNLDFDQKLKIPKKIPKLNFFDSGFLAQKFNYLKLF